MPVNIHGKDYKTVAERVNEFRQQEEYKHYSILTDIIRWDGDDVVIRAQIVDGDKVLATGIAHEVRGATNINKTSHVENCETSAIGRALASLGLAGTEYASADEVSTAVINQAVLEAEKRYAGHTQAILKHYESIMAIKVGIAAADTEGYSAAAEEWFTLDDDVKRALWIAPTKGGVFTTKERETIQKKEFREAYYGTDAAA